MMSPEAWKHLGSLWSAVGPLFGVYIGAQLAAQTHRAQWIADKKLEEYRELVTTLTQSMSTLVGLSGKVLDPDMQRSSANAYTAVLEVNRSRIFIANEIKPMLIPQRWNVLCTKLHDDSQHAIFTGDTELLIDEISKIALQEVMPDGRFASFLHRLGLKKGS